MKTKDELKEEIKKRVNTKEKLVSEIYKCDEEIFELTDKLLSLDETMVKIECVQCLGVGYTVEEGRKKRVCDLCKGKQYNFWRKFNEK